MLARTIPLAHLCALLLAAPASARPDVTAFTYQGRLMENGQPAQGSYDLYLRLYPSANSILPIGDPVALENVQVDNGLFTAKPDFGPEFDGGDRWISIGVRPGASTGSYTALSPRQQLTPTPMALTAKGLSLPVSEAGSTDVGLVHSGLLAITQNGTSNAILARNTSSGAAIRAEGNGSGPAIRAVTPSHGIGLELQGGGIKVKGSAGPLRVVGIPPPPWGTPSNIITIDDPTLNGNPYAVLIVTPRAGRDFSGVMRAPTPVYVAYDDDAARWTVRSFSGYTLPDWSLYNLLIIQFDETP